MEAKAYHMLVPRERIMHLSELTACRRLNESSEPAPITTPWMRTPATLVISLAAYYQPSSVIGIVLPTQVVEMDYPHFSIDIFLKFFVLNYNCCLKN